MSTHDRPNILWYCTDQQRYDTIRGLGNSHINTPNLDRFMGAGTTFTQAYCQSQICTPSRASFLTGRYPASNHVHRNGNAYFPPNEKLVTKMLAEAGYDCGLIGKLHLQRAAGHEGRTDDGYRLFEWSHHPFPNLTYEHHGYHRWLKEEKGVDAEELYSHMKSFCGPGVPAELHQTTWTTEMAICFINEERDGPWMLSMNPFDPHPPYDPPPEYLERYDPQTLPPPLFRESDMERQNLFANVCQQALEPGNPLGESNFKYNEEEDFTQFACHPPTEFNGREVKAAYYAMVEMVDYEFGRLITALEAAGQLDNTLIIFHSDHGETLGDHGQLYKGCRFWEGLVHVPLMFAWKGRIQEGLISDALVELIDIMPTVMDAAGLDIPANVQGKSLMPLLCGDADPIVFKTEVICHFNDALGSARESLPSHATMRFDGRYKTNIYHGLDLGELFDLQEDPGEFVNLWDDPAYAELKAKLVLKHLDAIMATSDAGIERAGRY